MLDRAGLSLANGGLGLRSAMKGQGQRVLGKLGWRLPAIRERHPSITDQFCVALQTLLPTGSPIVGSRVSHVQGDATIGVSTSQLQLIRREQLLASGFDCPALGGTSPGVCDQGRISAGRPHVWGPQRVATRCGSASLIQNSAQGLCGRDCFPASRRSSVPKAGRWQVCRSVASHHPQRPGSSPRTSACCSSNVSGAHCPCPRQVAGVAVHSIEVATTALLVRTRRRFRAEGDSPWRGAAARVCREAGRRVTANVRVQDLDLPPRAGADNRRQEVVALSLQSTPQWCPQCAWTVLRAGNAQPQMGLPWPEPAFGKSALTPNLLRLTIGHAWWWWLAKSVAGVPQLVGEHQGAGRARGFQESGQGRVVEKVEGSAGVCKRRGHSLCPSWNDVVLLGATVPRLPLLRWSGPTGTRRSA